MGEVRTSIGVEDPRALQIQRGLRLEYITIAYNLLEAVSAMVAGLLAGSVALVGFSLDSIIEVTSGAALVWRLTGDHKRDRELRDQKALRTVGVCFLALAAYIGFDSGKALILHEAPEESIWGIVIAVGSIIVMPILARAKRRVAASIGSASLHADAKQTELCTYLSVIVLAGLALNASLGWWWADPLAGLAMIPIIVKEGIAGLRGESCGCSTQCSRNAPTIRTP
jgi:divalent metal cation (Fe/Co/Zn/Cd) transporter